MDTAASRRRASLPTQGEAARRAWWRHHLVAGLVGFAAGVFFWHAVGFWGFVNQVVMRGPEPAQSTAGPLSTANWLPFIGRALTNSSAAPQTDPHCNDVVLDRASGIVEIRSCQSSTAGMKANASRGRSDRLRQVAERE